MRLLGEFPMSQMKRSKLGTDGAAVRSGLILGGLLACLVALPVRAQQADPVTPPSVVRPGAPGQPTRILPSTTRAALPQRSAKDAEFMRGMIMHHAQAVEMTDLIGSRTPNKNIRLLGARIAKSQSDEMEFMKRWLETRGESSQMSTSDTHGTHGAHSASKPMLMPGMLTPVQMGELRRAKNAEFDRLFLTGMIQHHDGALIMVGDLFNTAGAGQDAELFNFATDVDTSQRAEINVMRNMLGEKSVKEKL